MLRKLAISLALITPSATQAQPYSESMADCASVYQNAAQWVRTDESAEKLMVVARRWHAAAVAQSQAEGRRISETAMWDKIDSKTEEWEAKGAVFAFSEEFRDWTSYCRKFAKHTGVEINS